MSAETNLTPEVGRRYKVDLDDCCIEGQFTATVTKYEPEYPEGPYIEFDNGVLLTNWHGCWFRLPDASDER